jgi:hypothetical protein
MPPDEYMKWKKEDAFKRLFIAKRIRNHNKGRRGRPGAGYTPVAHQQPPPNIDDHTRNNTCPGPSMQPTETPPVYQDYLFTFPATKETSEAFSAFISTAPPSDHQVRVNQSKTDLTDNTYNNRTPNQQRVEQPLPCSYPPPPGYNPIPASNPAPKQSSKRKKKGKIKQKAEPLYYY